MARFSRILVTDNNKSSSKTAEAAPPPQPDVLESDFVIILAVLLCALICVVGLIAAARCACRRRRENNRRSGSSSSNNRYPSPRSSANKGLKKKVLQSLPKFTYTTAQSQGVNNGGGSDSVKLAPLSSECAICLGEFVEGDELRVLPQCGHGFHVACIDKWLGSHSSCPSCRQILAVGRCQKCSQLPAVCLPSAAAAAAAGAGGGNEAELNGSENRAFTAISGAAFLP